MLSFFFWAFCFSKTICPPASVTEQIRGYCGLWQNKFPSGHGCRKGTNEAQTNTNGNRKPTNPTMSFFLLLPPLLPSPRASAWAHVGTSGDPGEPAAKNVNAVKFCLASPTAPLSPGNVIITWQTEYPRDVFNALFVFLCVQDKWREYNRDVDSEQWLLPDQALFSAKSDSVWAEGGETQGHRVNGRAWQMP